MPAPACEASASAFASEGLARPRLLPTSSCGCVCDCCCFSSTTLAPSSALVFAPPLSSVALAQPSPSPSPSPSPPCPRASPAAASPRPARRAPLLLLLLEEEDRCTAPAPAPALLLEPFRPLPVPFADVEVVEVSAPSARSETCEPFLPPAPTPVPVEAVEEERRACAGRWPLPLLWKPWSEWLGVMPAPPPPAPVEEVTVCVEPELEPARDLRGRPPPPVPPAVPAPEPC